MYLPGVPDRQILVCGSSILPVTLVNREGSNEQPRDSPRTNGKWVSSKLQGKILVIIDKCLWTGCVVSHSNLQPAYFAGEQNRTWHERLNRFSLA